ncbi:hypothetical protein [Herbidospora mongoliensis]|uniref:hypothetical protein n=1 Tax=Herbidospora mongoliensis TaxID=688067 RepID=UPI000AE78896|nr:hypothetical protein [Herbidospora mongoliensis]
MTSPRTADEIRDYLITDLNNAMYEEPILQAARCGTGRFQDTFTLTPAGENRTGLQVP